MRAFTIQMISNLDASKVKLGIVIMVTGYCFILYFFSFFSSVIIIIIIISALPSQLMAQYPLTQLYLSIGCS